jgi:hypothetical protein
MLSINFYIVFISVFFKSLYILKIPFWQRTNISQSEKECKIMNGEKDEPISEVIEFLMIHRVIGLVVS